MPSSAELLLSVQLEQAGIPFEREFRFAPEDWCREHGFLSPTGRPRRWRADFMLRHIYSVLNSHRKPVEMTAHAFLVEIEGGSFTGGHKRGRAYESDCDKNNAAMMLGWPVFRFTPAMVDDGRALAVIRQALGLEVAA